MIRIEGLTKNYGDHMALAGIDLHVTAAEIFGFLGPNGAGKTTTIRILTGLVRPTLGRVLLGGVDVQTRPLEAKRTTGYIPDRPYLHDKLTGYEFLAFVGGLYGLDPDQVVARARPRLEDFDLTRHCGRLIESFSHGMKQKLMIIASLLHEPRILVVDEPMVGLDPRSARKVCEMLRGLKAQGVTIFLSTHTLSVADAVCDRVGIIHRGKLLSVGPPALLKEKASMTHGSLEEVFLKLTEEAADEEAGLIERPVDGATAAP